MTRNALALAALLAVAACSDEDDPCPTYAGSDCAVFAGQDGQPHVACSETTLGPCSDRPDAVPACVFVEGVYCSAETEQPRPAPR